jgi:hypothetical protein
VLIILNFAKTHTTTPHHTTPHHTTPHHQALTHRTKKMRIVDQI